MGGDFAFQSWNYVKASFCLDPAAQNHDNGCTGTGCNVSLMDKTFLKDRHLDVEISKMASSLQVHGVGASKHATSQYVTIPIHMSDVDKAEDKVLVCITRGFHLVEDLRANVLTGNDNISPEAWPLW